VSATPVQTSALARLPRPNAVTGTTVIGAATVIVAAIAAIAVHGFATSTNLRGLCLSVSLVGIIAVGLSLITIVGKIFSLAIPATVALTTILFAETLHMGAGIALVLAVAMSTAIGAIQGVIVGRFEADPIITTIAAAAILVGLGQIWTDGATIVGHGDTTFFNSNLFDFLPFQTAAFIGVAAVAFWWHRFTVAGRKLTLIGLNERAALVSGLRSWPSVVLAFTVSGATTGVAAALLSAQSENGSLTLGANFGFDAIVAVVVGGVGIKGGVGTPLGAAAGAIFVGLLENVLALIGLSYEWQLVSKGVIVLAAVAVMGVAGKSERSA
jgi:ribose/xylose/arabinose/galactoside ABC-type transport system permease subunit